MNETDYKSPWIQLEEGWFALTSSEKALVLNYAKRLLKDEPVTAALINAVSDIHEKYPGFYMDCVPNELLPQKLSEGA
jgi:hypothetical protein